MDKIYNIIEQLKKEKADECETCGCQRYDFCNGYNKAIENLQTKFKNLKI